MTTPLHRLAQWTGASTDRYAMVTAAALTIAGLWLRWRGPRQRMSLEESVKDGRMSEPAAGRYLRGYRWAALLLVALGLVLMTLTTLATLE